MSKKMKQSKNVTWLSEEIISEQKGSISFRYYEKFQFKNIVGEIGDFVLISNADSAEPDTEGGCDVARITSLYEDPSNDRDPFRARVQWYSRPDDVPLSSFNSSEPIQFLQKEVLEDHRPFNTDVSIQTFFKKCNITFTFTRDTGLDVKVPYSYICRYRVMPVSKRKVHMEPVLEEERNALELLCTPSKSTPKTPKTPTSLVKNMSRVSISERNWSISKNDGTKLLLKRALLGDKNEKGSPKKEVTTPKSTTKKVETPRSSRKMSNANIEDVLSMELKENSDEELPTLIIRQHVLSTPRRKSSVVKTNDETPKKMLLFNDDEKDTPTTRSGRIKKPVCYTEPEISPVKRTSRATRTSIARYSDPEVTPVKRTPRKSVRKVSEGSDDDFKPITKTPKTPKTSRTLRATPGKTPKRRIVTSELTPTLHSRAHSVDNCDVSDFIKDDKSLPGREQQMEEIQSFVRTKLLEGTSGCMYISGVPGTGKTATVNLALRSLQEEPELPAFQLVEVNGMRIAEPRQAYVQIYKQLTGKTVVWEQACSLLEKRFTNPGPRRTPTVLLVDELDALCNRRQDVLYSIMEWAAHNSALLTVLAVANTMDLPERALKARVASRLGLTRLTFPPYTHSQLQCIVATRLAGANVTPDAVQLIARKVAAVSGDARRALALCTRALELAGPERADLSHVQRALSEAAGSAAVRAIAACAPVERLMLRAIAAEVERTGSDETTLSRALMTAGAIVALDGRPYRSATQIRAPTLSQALAACSRLATHRLILLEPKPAEPRLLLNVSVDDVHYATKQISV